MNQNLKCFISASYDTDLSLIKNILAENNIETFDLYDFSIGDSIQQILKRKLRQADFALFVVSRDNQNVIYEMGVCEGLGKQHFIFLEKAFKAPFYIENKLFIRANLQDRQFLQASIQKVLHSLKKRPPKPRKSKPTESVDNHVEYSRDIKDNLSSYLEQVKNLRQDGHGRVLEHLIKDTFKSIRLNYVENSTNRDKGVDFALWSDELGKIVGNPIIAEVKYGNINQANFKKAEQQLLHYSEKTEAKVAILIYLDKNGKRHKIKSSLNPLIISYDAEDFISDLLTNSFEKLVLNQRNKIAHGIE